MRRQMTTKSPLIRKLGNGYCASWNGFYLHDEDLPRVLARIAELMQAASERDDERASVGAARTRDRATGKPILAPAE